MRTLADTSQKRLGRGTPETEHIYAEFKAGKQQVDSLLRSLIAARRHAERLKRAVPASRVRVRVIDALNTVEKRQNGGD